MLRLVSVAVLALALGACGSTSAHRQALGSVPGDGAPAAPQRSAPDFDLADTIPAFTTQAGRDRCETAFANARMDARVLTGTRVSGSLGLGIAQGVVVVPAFGTSFSSSAQVLAAARLNRAVSECRAVAGADAIGRWLSAENARIRSDAENARAARLWERAQRLEAVRARFEGGMDSGDLSLTEYLAVEQAVAEIAAAASSAEVEAARHRAVIESADAPRDFDPRTALSVYLDAARKGQAAENELRRAGAQDVTVTIGLGFAISAFNALGAGENGEDEALSEDAAARAAAGHWGEAAQSIAQVRAQARAETAALERFASRIEERRKNLEARAEPLASVSGLRAEGLRAALEARLALVEGEEVRVRSLVGGLRRLSGALAE